MPSSRSLASQEQWQHLTANNASCDVLSSSCSLYSIRSVVLRELVFVFQGTKTNGQLLLEGWDSLQPEEPFVAGHPEYGKVGASKFCNIFFVIFIFFY
jgi:hypothetical protein